MSDTLSNFMDIWDVEQHFKCPVIGAVLSETKHRNILKKCGYDVRKMKPYEYHRCIMEKLDGPNNVSIKVNNYLLNQARKYMAAIDGLEESKVRAMWAAHLKEGNVGPLLFAIVACRDTGPEMLCDVSGEVHMLAHANMTGILDVRKELQQLKETRTREDKKSKEKTQTIKSLVKTRKSQDDAVSRLEARNRALELEVQELRAQLPDGENGAPMEDLKEKVATLQALLQDAEGENRRQAREQKALEIELFSLRNKNRLLDKELNEFVDNFSRAAQTMDYFPAKAALQSSDQCRECGCKECEGCPGPQLCAKRIFMIGGITKMKAHYKEIVENAGGSFEYHDGYMKNTNANLEAKVRRSDLVICPVNCNSHTACLKVKKLCNQYDTELKMLHNSSLAALTRAVFHPEDDPSTC
ncbi:MAG: DUF2325 domain-containing protein [Desulfobacterales bacterium]|nr:DUF2325 domain-containing protein [Desulfobacterales bacterium]